MNNIFKYLIIISLVVLNIIQLLIELKNINYLKNICNKINLIKNFKNIKIINFFNYFILPYKEIWTKGWFTKFSLIISGAFIFISGLYILLYSNITSLPKKIILFMLFNIFIIVLGAVFISVLISVINKFIKKINILDPVVGDYIVVIYILNIIPNVMSLYLIKESLIKSNYTIYLNTFSLILALYFFIKILILIIKNPKGCIGNGKFSIFSLFIFLLFLYIFLSTLLIINLDILKKDSNGIFEIGSTNKLIKILIIVIMVIFTFDGFDNISNYSKYEYIIILLLIPISVFFWTVFVSKLISNNDDL